MKKSQKNMKAAASFNKRNKNNEFYHFVSKLSTSTENENRGTKLVVKTTV
jgi:hypothetical protein